MVDISFVLAAGAALVVGAIVQSSIGLGMGLVAAPVIALLQPELLPGTMLIPAVVLPLLTVRAEIRSVDWRGLAWATPARIAGIALGVWVVATLPAQQLAATVGVMVLAAVALTVGAVRLRTTPATLTVAGLVSGVTGTTTSIGGPPVALVYQHEDAAVVRATLGVYFCVGALLSLFALYLGGQLPAEQVTTGLVLVPFVPAGFVIARPLRRVLDGGRPRIPLLVVVSIAGIVLIAQAIGS